MSLLVRLQATVEKSEGKHVSLLLEDGQSLQVPKESFGGLVPPMGALIAITVQPAAEAEQDQLSLAHTLINQFLTDDKG